MTPYILRDGRVLRVILGGRVVYSTTNEPMAFDVKRELASVNTNRLYDHLPFDERVGAIIQSVDWAFNP